MKKTTPLLTIVLLALLGPAAVSHAAPLKTEDAKVEAFIQKAEAYAKKDQWKGFSENLVVALKSDHDGLRVAAMGMVIRFGEKVNVSDAVFDVMRIYRSHNNEDMRRMALVTLGNMESEWAIGFLTRAEKFEKSAVLKQTMRAVINDYHVKHAS